MKQEKFEYDTFFHVYNRGNNKEDIFIEDKLCNYFVKLLHLLELKTIIVKIDKISLFMNKTSFNTLRNMDLDLEQRKSMNLDSNFISKKMLKSNKLIQDMIHLKLDTICFQL